MSYSFMPGQRYRMPTHFGPAPGPRQAPGGGRYECRRDPRQIIAQAAYAAPADLLEAFMPPGFVVRRSEMRVTFCYMTEVAWLAGRGYNTFGVTVPATWTGGGAPVHGDFMLVLWENMADPIISGREELGFAKLYCDLPPPLEQDGGFTCRASWDGHEFASLRLADLSGEPPAESAVPPSEGLLHYRYVPRVGAPGEADAHYPVITPYAGGHLRVERQVAAASATCRFRSSSWSELPTLYHIVNRLAEVTLGPCIGASISETRGAKDLSDQRILS